MAAVERVASGDVQAFEAIVRRNQGRLFAFGRRFFSNLADVEDFVQEVFLQAFRKLETYRRESRFTAWLLTIAYHLAVRQQQRIPQYTSLDAESVRDQMLTPEQIAMQREAEQTVLKEMRALPERFATCLDLFFFFGLTYKEISAAIGAPVNTVRSYIRRAKETLRRALAPQLLEDSHGMP
jgi:RNA polymerase sigma-70 factor (ECF subfamily)